VGQVVARVDGGAHLAAMRAEETEVALAHFGRRPGAAEVRPRRRYEIERDER
jgi:hypothetical protein